MPVDIGQELYEQIKAEFDKLTAADGFIKAVAGRISAGTATMEDVSLYAQQLGVRLRQVLGDKIRADVLPNGQMYYNIAEKILGPILHDNYDLVNQTAADVQRILDKRNNINIKPQKAAFPDERVQAICNAAKDQEAARAAEIMGRASDTVSRSFADDYMEENAKFRSKAGFQTYIVRATDGKCCDWCSRQAGKYSYPDATPHEVFQRHDNCGCTVTYENGGMRQDVWSKRSWEATPEELAERKELEEKNKPVRFSPEEAAAKEREVLFQAKPGKDDNAIADMDYINSQAYADKFKGKYANERVENAVVSACRQIIKNRDGTFFEEAYFIDAHSGEVFSYVKGKKKNGVKMPEKLKRRLTNAPESSIIMIHNHPNSSPFSRSDYLTSSEYNSCYETIAVGHNGDVFSFRNTFGTQGELLGYFEENGNRYPYYESIRDYRISYSKHISRGVSDFDARNNAWKEVSEMRGFTYEKR